MRIVQSLTGSMAVGAAVVLAACGGGDGGGDTGGAAKVPAPDAQQVSASLSKWGWTPPADRASTLSCTDDSYAEAVENGITYGTYELPPYFMTDGDTASGIEWEMLKTAATYAGIDDVKFQVADFDSLIPSIQAGRVDLMPAHETKDRLKAIAFTTPVYWYGPTIAVPKDNPGNITGFEDLTGDDVKVGVVKGSAAQIYMEQVKGTITPYKDQNSELAALSAGRDTAALEDSVTIAEYIKANPDAKIEVLEGKSLDPKTLYDLGYGYFEYGISKDACSLNAALSQSIAMLRAEGVYKNILSDAGLGGLARVNMPGTED